MQKIEMPNGDTFEFPDEMSDNDIQSALKPYSIQYLENSPPAGIDPKQVDFTQPQAQPKNDWTEFFAPSEENRGTMSQNETEAYLKLQDDAQKGILNPKRDSFVNETRGIGRLGMQSAGQMAPEAFVYATTPPIISAVAAPFVGALGYAGMNQLADVVYDEDQADFVDDYQTGMAFGMGGSLLKELIRAGKPALKSMLPTGKSNAAKILDPYYSDIKQAAEAEEIIPGTKLPLGVGSKDPKLRRLAQEVFNSSDEATQNFLEMQGNNFEKAKSYLNSMFPDGSADDLLENFAKISNDLERGVEVSKDDIANLASQYSIIQKKSPTVGAELRRMLAKAKKEAFDKVGAQWDALNDNRVNITDAVNKLNTLSNKAERYAKGDWFPGKMLTSMTKVVDEEGPQVSIKDLREWASVAGTRARDAGRAGKSGKAAMNKQVRSIIEDAIFQLSDNIPEYKSAKEAYRDVVGTYREGVVGEILGYNNAPYDSELVGKVFNSKVPEHMDEVKAALSNPEKNQAVKDQILASIREAAFDPEKKELDPKLLRRWYKDNVEKLQELGVESEFSDFNKVAEAALEAEKNSDAFAKSITAKILDADPDKKIAQIMKGDNRLKNIRKLQAQILKDGPRHDVALAFKGLKNSIKDYIMDAAVPKGGDFPSFNSMKKTMNEFRDIIDSPLFTTNEREAIYKVRQFYSMLSEVAPKGSLSINTPLDKIPGFTRATTYAGPGRATAEALRNTVSGLKSKTIGHLVEGMFDPESALKLVDEFRTVSPQKIPIQMSTPISTPFASAFSYERNQ
jgi:hypothetical protein